MRLPIEGAEVLFMVVSTTNFHTIDNVDVEVILDDGSRWSGSFLTLSAIDEIMRRREGTGEALSGTFFQCHDAVIVRRAGVPAMLEVVKGMVTHGMIQNRLVRLSDEED